jgi:glutathione S-transferase
MIKLLGRANSSNVMKVIWTLEELRLPYNRVDVGGPFGGTATPEYRAMNPLGLVPSLEEEGGFTLFESNAIARYLCNAHAPTSPLYPQAPRARAVVDAWMDFQQTAQNGPGSIVFLGLVRTKPEDRDHTAIAKATKQLAGVWDIVNNRLAHHPYVAGDSLTLADIAYGPHVHRWFTMPVEGRPEAPHLKAWYNRLLTHPAYKTHLARPVT